MKRILIGLLIVAAGGSLWANDFSLPPGKWWEDQRLVDRIGLTVEQQEQISSIVYQSALRMIDLNADVKRAGLELTEVVDRKEIDPAAVRKAFAAFQTARQKLDNERFEMLLAVRQVMTSVQWEKIKEIKRRLKQMRPQREPGQRPPGQRPQGPMR
ncbi:MAG: Spy/CpxP family protein refolding chaperone [Thermoanaerobaculales bacterium]